MRMKFGAILLLIAALSGGMAERGPEFGTHDDGPDIVDVQKRAIDYARLDPSEISKWKRRAAKAALLPKLQIEYDRRMRDYVNVDVNDQVYVGSNGVVVGPDSGSYNANCNNDNNISVQAVWSLGEAIFSPDSLAVSQEARNLARERQSILAEVNRNFYERRKLGGEIVMLEAELKAHPRDEKIRRDIFAKRVARDEAAAALDALTGGWFSEHMRDK